MTRTIRTLVILAGAITISAPASARQALPRSANNGPAEGANGPAAVAVPRHPYAGSWDGTLTMDDTKAPVKLAMAFQVSDAERQAYGGETIINGGPKQAHLNISSAPASETDKSAAAPIARRSPGDGGQAGSTGLADGSATERDTLANADHALLLFHTPTKSMLLCDDGHRCVALASLTWQEIGTDGARYAYTAKIVSADAVTGTVTVTNGSKTQTGTFALARRK